MPSKSKLPDIRMVEREKRRQGANTAEIRELSNFVDLAANVAVSSQEDLDKLSADLSAEGEARDRRIERFVREGPLKPVPRAVVPISENDL
jgi:hypothetical protein